MPNCSPQTLVITRPTGIGNNGMGCGQSCNNIGPTDWITEKPLGQRRKREIVIEQIKDYVVLMLGAPTIGLELNEQHIDLAVKQTLKIMEYFAPREYYNYYNFITNPMQSVYKMPDDVGYIRNVIYRQVPEFAFQSQDLQGAIPIEYFYPGGAYASIQGGLIDPIQPIWGRAGEWVLYKQYERMYTRVSSGLGGWEWVSDFGHIKLYPIPYRAYHVVVHYMQKQKDWNDVTLAMQEGALAHAKMMLGLIRRKYRNPPGPNGGIQLDGTEMYQEGKEEYEKWKEELLTKWGDLPPITLA
jgi:hypothetical protein